MTARLLMIALDGADARLLDRWSAAGDLPNLAALRARGGVKRLVSPPGSSDDGLWASFQYGVPLGEHGRYHYLHRLRSGAFGMFVHAEYDRVPFWKRVADAGHRVAIFDVPKCTAPRVLNGIHLADWQVHGHSFKAPLSYPEPLAKEVVERFGAEPPSRCGYHQQEMSDDAVRTATDNLLTAAAQKRAAGLAYLGAEAWDLFIIAFKEGHCAGHLLWHFVDPAHPRYDGARNLGLGEPLRAIFSALDAAVGDLVLAAGQDAEVVVFSTTEMEPNGTLQHMMPQIVERLNRALTKRHTHWYKRALDAVRRKKRIRRFWKALPYNENCGALRLTRASVRNGDAALFDETEALLADLVDEETGAPTIVSCSRPARALEGAKAAALPDLLLHCSPGTIPRAVSSPKLGRIVAESAELRSGNHASGGFAIAVGAAAESALGNVSGLEDMAALARAVI